MPAILLHLLAAALYLSLAAHFWRTRWRGPALDQPPSRLGTLARIWLLVAIVAHGITVVTELFGGGQMRFGFAVAVDRKSTRLNSSHVKISYAVYCLKKKKK